MYFLSENQSKRPKKCDFCLIFLVTNLSQFAYPITFLHRITESQFLFPKMRVNTSFEISMSKGIYEIMFDSTEIRVVWGISPTSELLGLYQFPDMMTKKIFFQRKM